VGSGWALDRSKDWIVPYYRDMALCLVMGFSPRDVFLAVFGKRDDPSTGGRQMPAHWGSRRLRIITHSSPIATQIPHAVGAAYASTYRGEDAVTGCWFGEGATSEGDWHEALNFAGIHRLPVVFFCENNQYAISVPLGKQMAIKDVAMRAQGYGVLSCYEASKTAVDRARAGEGPTLVEFKTYRLRPHTSDDDDRTYRSREEVEHAKANDPLIRFAAYMKETELLNDEAVERIEAEVKTEIERAVEEAWNAPDPDPESAFRHVFADSPPGDQRP